MNIKMSKTRIRAIRPEDDMFQIEDGLVVANRASIEITKNCPARYRTMIVDCINAGYIQPVAHMRDDEYMWESLK